MKKNQVIFIAICIFIIVCGIFIGLWNQSLNRKTVSKAMEETIIALAQTVEREVKFLKTDFTEENYTLFIASLEKDFDALEQEFSQLHSQVQMDTNDEEDQLIQLFVQVLDYHYMILENRLAMHTFEQAVNELTGFIESKRVTSTQYNHELEVLMQEYGGLMNYSALVEDEPIYSYDIEELEKIRIQLQDVQRALSQIDVSSDEDMYVHQRVIQMFTSVEQGISAVYDYSFPQVLEEIHHDGIMEYTNKQLLEIAD